jgi:steroid 5-alpha reductase family enzyme
MNYNRFMVDKLLLVPWLIGIVYSSIPLYWLAIHPFSGRWQAMTGSPYRILLPFWMILVALLALLTWPWHWQQLYSTGWAWAPASLLFIAGLRTYGRIVSEFGLARFTGMAQLRPQEHEQALVTTGLHTQMRHPIYFAHVCMFAGWTIGSGLTVDFILLAISLFCTFPLMIWLEERELEKRFGQSFREYKARVPLFPGGARTSQKPHGEARA